VEEAEMRILIADDDDTLRELLETLLTRSGHEVVATRDGAEALRAYRLADVPFDFLITDYQMPRKNGVVLIMDIRRINPNQKVIMVSGDPPQIDSLTRKDTGEFPMLQKPYRTEALLNLLK
jgi:two-component system cell cycle sensor histidine kinase/response regulator CckA